MGKRTKINYNSEELAESLKQSTGKGVDAFFPESSPTDTDRQKTDLPVAQEIDVG